jgi:hypothetical protein
MIPVSAPNGDIVIEVRSIIPSEVAVFLEYVEWHHIFPNALFMPKPVKIANVDENGIITWDVDTDFLKSCIGTALSIVYPFNDTISHIEPITVQFDTLYDSYILKFDAHFASSTGVYSGDIVLNEEDGDIYLDPDEPQPQPIIWIVVAIAAAAILSGCDIMPNAEKVVGPTCAKHNKNPCSECHKNKND